MPSVELLEPCWNAPAHVRAATTTRRGGLSRGPFAGLNLASHVGDDPVHVAANRALLRASLRLANEPMWLEQVHGCEVLTAGTAEGGDAPPCPADAAVSDVPGPVCAVLTADCLPLLLCDRDGSVVAAVHAGWRGLLHGVIEAAVARMRRPSAEIMAWLGPAIGPNAFEVGSEVRALFCERSGESASAFAPCGNGRFLADLYALARQRLARVGVSRVSGGEYCTHGDAGRFYSFRRDGQTGRMASLVWIDGQGRR